MSIYETPNKKPQIDSTNLGPNLSFKLPMMIPNAPCTIQESEKAPDVRALLQPNSALIGFKKTPKAN